MRRPKPSGQVKAHTCAGVVYDAATIRRLRDDLLARGDRRSRDAALRLDQTLATLANGAR